MNTDTRVTTIRLNPRDQKRLKLLSAEWGKTVGQVFEGLLDFAELSVDSEDDWGQATRKALLETCILNAGIEAVFDEGEDGEPVKPGEREKELQQQILVDRARMQIAKLKKRHNK